MGESTFSQPGASSSVQSALMEYLGAASDFAEIERIINSHPELLSPSADVALERMIAGARQDGLDDGAVNYLGARRQLLQECRRLGVGGAMMKFEGQVLVGRFVDAPDPASKLRVIEENPRILEVGDIVLHQGIDAARQAGQMDAVRVFEQHLWLLVMSKSDGPRNAFAAAFGKRGPDVQ